MKLTQQGNRQGRCGEDDAKRKAGCVRCKPCAADWDNPRSGGGGECVQGLGNQGPLGFVGLCWTIFLKNMQTTTENLNDAQIMRIPEISGDFQSIPITFGKKYERETRISGYWVNRQDGTSVRPPVTKGVKAGQSLLDGHLPSLRFGQAGAMFGFDRVSPRWQGVKPCQTGSRREPHCDHAQQAMVFDDFRRFPEISNQFQSLLKKICKNVHRVRLADRGIKPFELPGAVEFAGAVGGAMVLSGRQDAPLYVRPGGLTLRPTTGNADEFRPFPMISNQCQSLFKKL